MLKYNNNRRGRPRRGRGRGTRTKTVRGRDTDFNRTVGLSTTGRINPLKFSFQSPSVETTMRYHEIFSLTVPGSSMYQQLFNLNSIYDPNRTGIGHNPQGYTQMSVLYNRYLVTKVKILIQSSSVQQTYFICVTPSNGTFPGSITYEDVCEYPFSFSSPVGGGGSPNYIYNRTIGLSNLGGVSKTKYLVDDRYSSIVTSDPGENMILGVFIQNPNVSSQITQVDVHLEYTTIFYDPIQPLNTTYEELCEKIHDCKIGINRKENKEVNDNENHGDEIH